MTEFQLTSEELNEKIFDLDGREDLPYIAFGGKAVPYIGWYWRQVYFDVEVDYQFGVMPEYDLGIESNAKVRVGFMENNKWGYGYVRCPAEDFVKIRRLLETAVLDPTHDNFKAVDDKIQSLLQPGT